jgi:hypothetical protein
VVKGEVLSGFGIGCLCAIHRFPPGVQSICQPVWRHGSRLISRLMISLRLISSMRKQSEHGLRPAMRLE